MIQIYMPDFFLLAIKTQRNITPNSKATETPFQKIDTILVIWDLNTEVGANSVEAEDFLGKLIWQQKQKR